MAESQAAHQEPEVTEGREDGGTEVGHTVRTADREHACLGDPEMPLTDYPVAEDEENYETEAMDELAPLEPAPSNLGLDPQVLEQIMQAKQNNPTQFASYWEMDEADIDLATDEDIKSDSGTRMLWAAETGNEEVLLELLRLDCHLVATKDKDNYTPLHRAAYENHTNIIQILLEHGADTDARTIEGWSPLHSACHWGNTEAAGMLLAHNADINATTNSGQTPLHLAANCKTNDKRLLELILYNENLNPKILNNLGQTARELCERANQFAYLFDIVEDFICKLNPD